MKPNLLVLSILFISSLAHQSCKEEVSAPSSDGKEQVIQKTSGMTNGQITSAGILTDDNNKNHWEVKVDMTGDGGIVKFEYTIETQALREIKGLTPSFDYEIDPGNGLITYSAARSIALKALSGEIVEWKLEKDESYNNWQYRFQIISSGNDQEVRIAASDGTIIRIKS
jgi:uncharacterized membrane protein YkoI